VVTLVNEQQVAGAYQVKWNGTNSQNEAVPTGVYLAVLANQGQQHTLKLLYLK
jgi:flagellar hook assembly protein FlgD